MPEFIVKLFCVRYNYWIESESVTSPHSARTNIRPSSDRYDVVGDDKCVLWIFEVSQHNAVRNILQKRTMKDELTENSRRFKLREGVEMRKRQCERKEGGNTSKKKTGIPCMQRQPFCFLLIPLFNG